MKVIYWNEWLVVIFMFQDLEGQVGIRVGNVGVQSVD